MPREWRPTTDLRSASPARRASADVHQRDVVLEWGVVAVTPEPGDEVVQRFLRGAGVRMCQPALESLLAERGGDRRPPLERTVRVEKDCGSSIQVGEAELVGRIRLRPEQRAAYGQLLNLPVRQKKRRRMTRVDVGQEPVRLQLAEKERYEPRRQTALVDDSIE